MQSAVFDAATRVRRAFEQGELSLPSFDEFPRGSCGDASEMLGQFLHDAGLGRWYLHSTWFGEWSHGWIEQAGLIVDITADQFETVADPVLVTRDRAWHGLGAPDRQLAGIHWWDGHAYRLTARADYALIQARAAR